MRFSEQFNLPSNQAHHDFVDVPLDTDLAVFLDPYVIATTRTPWCVRSHQIVSDFFQTLLNKLRNGDSRGALELLCVSREDNRPRTGYSRRQPQGTGVGPEKAQILIDRLMESAAFASGNIQELEDGALFADRIGLDTVSDLMVNLLHEQLAAYTLDQCALLGVPANTLDRLHAWRPGEGWVVMQVRLPAANGRPVLLIPRSVVRTDLWLNSDAFLQHVLDDVDRGSEHATRALERALQQPVPTINYKNGKVRTHRGKLGDMIRDLPGSKKTFVAKLASECPETLPAYKRLARTKRSVLSPIEIDKLHRDPCLGDQAVESNPDASSASWTLVSGMVAAFHPLLQHPQMVHTNVEGVVGVTMATGEAGIVFRPPTHMDGEHVQPRVLVLSVDRVLDRPFLKGLDVQRMLRDARASIAICVATGVHSAVYDARAEWRDRGLAFTTLPELSQLMRAGLQPEEAIAAFRSLVGV